MMNLIPFWAIVAMVAYLMGEYYVGRFKQYRRAVAQRVRDIEG